MQLIAEDPSVELIAELGAQLTAVGTQPPCFVQDPELWFSDTPQGVEEAKALCRACPLRQACLTGALERREPWGVWGGELLVDGAVVARKRPRGRPRKDAQVA
jgi:WhiB family redox-sensing transcriptional regulator